MNRSWVALLRALNVGGKAVVKMADVRAAFETAGCRDVTTIGAAGNIVFTPGPTRMPVQQQKVIAAVHGLMGTRTAICFRRLDDVADIVALDPFGHLVADASLKLYVAFMDRQPTPQPHLPLLIPKEGLEMRSVRGREMFIVSRRKPNGMYGFPNLFVERLGVTATTRNWNTVTRLAGLATVRRK